MRDEGWLGGRIRGRTGETKGDKDGRVEEQGKGRTAERREGVNKLSNERVRQRGRETRRWTVTADELQSPPQENVRIKRGHSLTPLPHSPSLIPVCPE